MSCSRSSKGKGKGKSKGKGKGSSSTEEDSVPICAATDTKCDTEYQTLCVTPSFLEELAEEYSGY